MAQSHKIPGGLSAVNFVEATTPSGRVQGYVNQHGGVSFLGIPFAVPPIGNNRWKTTIPIPNWSGTLDATLQKPGCPQICKENYLCPPIISEDCLYLNIYVPPLEAGQTDISAKQRPVLFFVPGGAFRRGSSHLYDSEASTLAQRMDAVIVIVSYRLGPLGFFLTEAKEGVSHSPNYGVDDIRTAHAWVVKSISSFGGLPSEITLVGQSAGSLIGAYLIGAGNPNPITFKAAALLSIPNSPLRNLAEAEEDRQLLLKELGCSPNDIACARGKTAGALIGAEHDRETNLNGFMSFPLMPMIVDNLEVTSQPAYALQHDYRGNVPVLIGMTKAEGHEYVNTVSHRPLRKIIADAVLRTWWPTVSDSAVVKSYYTKDVLYKGYLDHFGFLVNLMTDYLFLCPSRQALKNLGSTSSSPAYGIFLDGGMSYKEDVPAGTYCDGAACHGVDILFMFTGTEPFANILTQAIRGLVHSADPNAYASESGVVIPQLSPATASGVPVAEIFRNGTSAAMPFPRNKYCDDWEALSADRPYDLRARAINRETSPFVLCVTLVSVILGGILLLHLAIFFRWKKFTKHSRTAVSADSVNARQPIQEPVPVAVAGLNVVLSGKYILSDVSLYFPAGKMTGLLGPSGAGKSTLIHHLTGSVGKGSARDVIFYGKSSLSHISVERLKRMIGLVEQTDCPYSSLTLQSVLEAAAVILLDSSTDEERLARVDEVTEILNLTGCVDVLVDKLSGGQKRRMTIAVQLLKKPPVLFLGTSISG
ncbi:Alpha/Beta hydrolase protein [Powellomyces hirtus]|nr:Alpha/Beta hydrolase protein [Powellomyces hirtus]